MARVAERRLHRPNYKHSTPQLWQGRCGAPKVAFEGTSKQGSSQSSGARFRLRPWPGAARRSWTASLGRISDRGLRPCAGQVLRSRRLATSLKTASKSFTVGMSGLPGSYRWHVNAARPRRGDWRCRRLAPCEDNLRLQSSVETLLLLIGHVRDRNSGAQPMPKQDLSPPSSQEAMTLRLLGVRMIGSTFPRNWRMFLLRKAERGKSESAVKDDCCRLTAS